MMKGSTASETCSIEMPEIRAATLRLPPSGGVRKPISQVITVRTPKSTGSTPREVTSGRKTEREQDDLRQALHEGADDDVEDADEDHA